VRDIKARPGARSRQLLQIPIVNSRSSAYLGYLPDSELLRQISSSSGLLAGHSLLPRLREAEVRLAGRNDREILKAGLREAEAMYRTMGAPDPAERLSQELES
jgi:hypothetical protein